MSKVVRKILVLLPVGLLTVYFLRSHYNREYRHTSDMRLLALVITVGLLYAWMIIGVIRRKQATLFQVLLQSSFYVYIFMVLTLTGYFILFREVSAHNWWHNMTERFERREGVNLVPFQSLKLYKYMGYQVYGNLVMLLPLGIYLPLLYKSLYHFFAVAFTCLLVSVSIELMQLATHFRVSDVDDVILNTTGACIGYLLLRLVLAIAGSGLQSFRANNLSLY
jgi:glycopeptide antibiotics resistance protein